MYPTRTVLTKTGRTIIRDPRKLRNNKVDRASAAASAASTPESSSSSSTSSTSVGDNMNNTNTNNHAVAPTTLEPFGSRSRNLIEKQQQRQNVLPFTPSASFHHQQQQEPSLGATLVSYMIAGVGVALGVTVVGAIFGGGL